MIRHRDANYPRRLGMAILSVTVSMLVVQPMAAQAQRMMGGAGSGGGFRGATMGAGPSGMGPTMHGSGYIGGGGSQESWSRESWSREPPRGSPHRPGPRIPYPGYGRNVYPDCGYGDRYGGCAGSRSAGDVYDDGDAPPRRRRSSGGSRRDRAQAAIDQRYISRQIVAELSSSLSDAQVDALARRHRLSRIGLQSFALLGTTVGVFGIADDRTVEAVQNQLRADVGVLAVQPNFRYRLQDQETRPALAEGDPAQYALAKLRLPEAHQLAHGNDVIVAVIDSGIDRDHPEFVGAIESSFDPLGSKEGPHAHGTGIAGAIVRTGG